MTLIRCLISQKGLSLVENMVAIGLFLIGISAIMSVQIQGMTSGKRAAAAYTAYNLAKNHIENLKAFSFSDVASAAETNVSVDENGTPDPDGKYLRSTAVTTGYTGDANLTQVVVSVYYLIQNVQSAQPMQLTTVLYNG